MSAKEWWHSATKNLTQGQKLRTWSLSRGLGTEFKIVRVSASEIVVAPSSSGEERTLVKGTFEKIEAYLAAPSSELRKQTFNSSYGLGILKALELI